MSLSSKARKNRRLKQLKLPSLEHSNASGPHVIYSPSSFLNSSNISSCENSLFTSSEKNEFELGNNSEHIQNAEGSQNFAFSSYTISSRPIEKVFIEDERGFRAIDINQFLQLHQVDRKISSCSDLAISLAYNSAKCFHNLSSFCHGVLGGISFIELLMFINIAYNPSEPEQKAKLLQFLSQPIHSIFNFLCIICCISAFDRYDVGNMKKILKLIRKYKIKLLVILIYPMCLLFSLSTVNVDEKMLLPEKNSTFWESFILEEYTDELFYWKTLSISKCAGAVIGWILVSVDSNCNLFIQNLKNIILSNSS